MRQKEYLAAIRSDGSRLTLSTLVFPDELVAPDSLEEFEQLEGIEVSDKELKMAKGLVDVLERRLRSALYTDEYRAAVEKIIEDKAAGASRPRGRPGAEGTVIDLAAALEASLTEAGAAKGRHRRPPARRRRPGSAPRPKKAAA